MHGFTGGGSTRVAEEGFGEEGRRGFKGEGRKGRRDEEGRN